MFDNKEHEISKPLTPRQIVEELDKYVIGQGDAKRAVAIALRNRWRRQQVEEPLRDDITPKNIIMIGPTGVGKTEIARRLAKLAQAPFVKVEATKFTEVGYVGRDVESMVRDLVGTAIQMVQREEEEKVLVKATENAEKRVLDLLLPKPQRKPKEEAAPADLGNLFSFGDMDDDDSDNDSDDESSSENTSSVPMVVVDNSEEEKKAEESYRRSREKMRKKLKNGELDEREVEVEKAESSSPMVEIFSSQSGLEEIDMNLKDMFGNMFPKRKRKSKMKVKDAMMMLVKEESQRLIDMDAVQRKALARAENSGIVFLDEMDKIAGGGDRGQGPDVSREGVQRDLLPIVEGSTVMTKHGAIKTDHILFVASGAFNVSKPSDLIPELQGRFPIRVELKALSREDFVRILTEPENSLTRQYKELLRTEGVDISFTKEAVEKLSDVAFRVNETAENIGARRLHTILERVLDEVLFEAAGIPMAPIEITPEYIDKRLKDVMENQDLSRYIL